MKPPYALMSSILTEAPQFREDHPFYKFYRQLWDAYETMKLDDLIILKVMGFNVALRGKFQVMAKLPFHSQTLTQAYTQYESTIIKANEMLVKIKSQAEAEGYQATVTPFSKEHFQRMDAKLNTSQSDFDRTAATYDMTANVIITDPSITQ